MKNHKSQIVVVAALIALLSLSTVNAGLLGDLGRIVGGSTEQLTQRALARVQREAAYRVIEAGLEAAGVHGARNFVDAIRIYNEDGNSGAAIAAIYTGLDNCGVEQAHDILKTLYGIAVAVRVTNAQVSDNVLGLIDYVNGHYHF